MDKPIIFFDGVCGLCNGFVNFVLRIDKSHIFSFAPIQGKTAKHVLSQKNLEDINTIVLYVNEQKYYKSDAFLRIFYLIGGLWKLLFIFKIVPTFLRDLGYHFVRKHRYQWFGKRDVCRTPTPQEREFFLD